MPEPLSIVLGGRSYDLNPNFTMLTALEEAFNRPLLHIADLFVGGEATLKLTTDTLAILLDWPPNARGELGEEIVMLGIGKTLERLQAFFLRALGIEE